MPSIFAHARSAHFAQTHLDFVSDDGGENQILATETLGFTQCEGRSDEITWMTWIGFPIDVVIIHRANHVAIEKRRIDWISLEARHECSGSAFSPALARRGGHRTVMLQQNSGVILLTTAERATNGIEPK